MILWLQLKGFFLLRVAFKVPFYNLQPLTTVKLRPDYNTLRLNAGHELTLNFEY